MALVSWILTIGIFLVAMNLKDITDVDTKPSQKYIDVSIKFFATQAPPMRCLKFPPNWLHQELIQEARESQKTAQGLE